MEVILKGRSITAPKSEVADSANETDCKELCRLALRGSREAWDALIARYQRRVLVSFLARGIRVDRAKEMTQEVWTRPLQQQRQGQLNELRLPGLALTQAAFLASDELRRLRRQGEGIESSGEHAPSIESVSGEALLINRARWRRAQEELARCPARAQTVFYLVYDAAMSHADAARRVGLSVQRVRQVLCEVRKKLRVALEEDLDD